MQQLVGSLFADQMIAWVTTKLQDEVKQGVHSTDRVVVVGWVVWFVVVFGCRVVLVSCCVVHCRAVFLVSSLTIFRERCLTLFCWCPAVPCCAVLFFAVI